MNSNARGTGPALYYNRTARYFPGLREGRGPNSNISVGSPRRGMGGRCPDAQHARWFLSETEDGPGIRPAETSERSGGFHPRGRADLFCER